MTTDSGKSSDGAWPSSTVAWYTVTVLVIAYIFSFVDRTILALLVQPLKADLKLSDTEVSLLHGFAFAVFYTFMGLPLGRIADSRNRRNLIAWGVTVWSLMTAACGLAKTFWHLFGARVGVGIGEAALSPAAYSLIADNFSPNRRGRALGIYTAGAFFGAGIAFVVGGQVVALLSDALPLQLPILGTVNAWQLTFFAVGLPGLIVTLLVMTLREPVRREQAGHQAGVRETIRYLVKHRRVFAGHFLGFAMLGLPFNVIVAWGPTYFIRTFGLDAAETGRLLGFGMLIFGTAGVVLGGVLADRFLSRGKSDGTLRVGVIAALGCAVFGSVATVLGSLTLTTALIFPLIFFSCFGFGAAPAALQLVAPNQMRGQVSALYLFVLNLVGIGVGPTLTAGITDFFFRDEAAVGASIAITCGFASLAAILLLWRCQRPFSSLVADLR